MAFNHDNGRVLTNREVIEIAKRGGVAKCVIRDLYLKQANGRPQVNRAWDVECITFGDDESTIEIGTQGRVVVNTPPADDRPFRQIVKGRGEVKLYYEYHTKDCGIAY